MSEMLKKRFVTALISGVFCFARFARGIFIIAVLTHGFTLIAGAEKEEEEGFVDLEGKIDRTIEVLEIIKEELVEFKKSEAGRTGEAEEEGALSGAIRGKTRMIARIWRKLVKAIEVETKKTAKAVSIPQDVTKLSEDVTGALKKTIEAMTIVKEELEELEKEQ